jgi:hypothetical protein
VKVGFERGTNNMAGHFSNGNAAQEAARTCMPKDD